MKTATTAPKPRRSLRRPPEFSPRVRWLLTVGLLTCAVLGTHLLCQLIGTLDFSAERFFSYFSHPTILLLNLLPVVLLTALTYFLTNRAWLAYLLSAALLLAMEFGNYFKIAIRGDPLMAEDFTLLGEAAGSVGDYEMVFPPLFFISIGLLLLTTLVLLRYARGRIPKRRRWLRAVGAVGCVVLALLSWLLWYGDPDLYNAQSNSSLFNEFREAENYASHGFFWSFLHSIDESLPEKPEGYSSETAQEVLGAYADADIPQEQRVNVIVTMLESYSDLSVFDGVSFTSDPYAALHALEAESFHGVLISDTNGGGTINAERSFLTGFAYPHTLYHRNTQSYVRWFAAQGYSTQGAHPGNDWFYNRDRVNPRLGFSRYDFIENHYDLLPTEGGTYHDHPDDAVFFADRREDYLSRDRSQPYFAFNVSYQGHSPYSETELTGGIFLSHDGISDGAYYQINNYLSSVADTGAQMGAFVDSFRDDAEPVVLVFFGDHKPTLGTGNCYYAELGINVDENRAIGCENLYSTPYLIWANDAAKKLLGKDFRGTGDTISPCYLMTELLDCCGWDGPAWAQCQRQMRQTLPVIHRRRLFVENGVWTAELSAAAQEQYDTYRIAEYYVRTASVKAQTNGKE